MSFIWSLKDSKPLIISNTNDLSKSFVKCFSSSAGKEVLNYLAKQTKERVLAADSSSNELWFLEGKRALFAHIMHLISQGKKGE